MGLFSRRRQGDPTDQTGNPPNLDDPTATFDQVDEAADDAEAGSLLPDQAADDGAAWGPWDALANPPAGRRLDLGALLLPVSPGLAVRFEVEKASGAPVAVSVVADGSAIQLQAFAAPRSSGLWDEIRQELAASAAEKGGTSENRTGRFGSELVVRLPNEKGKAGPPVRFIGVDGPRWFVRAVLTGPAATEAKAAAVLEGILADVVVVRGTAPRPPRELLALTMPGSARPEAVGSPDGLPPLAPRGPEIAEVR